MPDFQSVVARILAARASTQMNRAIVVAITGIDGCGKSHTARQIAKVLAQSGVRVASISIDGWLNLPGQRFSMSDPAEHFYLNAIRFDEMFAQLILPLRELRSVRLEAAYAEETATAYRKHTYEFKEIDVILLEGIFLLKRSFLAYYDLSVWIDCSFETALQRAIDRSQEGLPPEATLKAYRTIYFPAQEIHLQRDGPKDSATMVLCNDPCLGVGSPG